MFQCVWLKGYLGAGDKPNKVGALIWGTTMEDQNNIPRQVILAHFRPGKRNKKIMRWLKRVEQPVMITDGVLVEQYERGRHCGTFDKDSKPVGDYRLGLG